MYAPTKANECPVKNSRTGRLDPASFGPHFLREHMFIIFLVVFDLISSSPMSIFPRLQDSGW